MEQGLKAERVQDRILPVTPDRLQTTKLGDEWEVDATPNAISAHFPQPAFSASAAFLPKAAKLVEKHRRVPFVVISEAGVTVRLGNPPESGVTETDLDLAMALTRVA